jgi:hypothetical protein
MMAAPLRDAAPYCLKPVIASAAKQSSDAPAERLWIAALAMMMWRLDRFKPTPVSRGIE